MKVIHLYSLIIISFICFVLTSCPDDPFESGPEIEWAAGGNTMTYSYSGGVMSGVNIIKKFIVVEETGEIKIEANIGGDNKSCVSFVEEGKQYSVKVSCGLVKKGSSSKIILSSPSASKSITIDITGYSVNLKAVSIN